MPIARFQMEDGRVARFEVPEGTTPEQAQTMMQSHFAGQSAPASASPSPQEQGGIAGWNSRMGQTIGNVLGGAVQGAANIGTTLLDATGLSDMPREERMNKIKLFMQQHGIDPESAAYGAGEIGSEIAGTAGAAGLIAKPIMAAAKYVPQLQRAGQAIESAGFNVGAPAATFAGKAENAALRVGGGAVAGAGSASLVNPESAGAGAIGGGAFGMVSPIVGKAISGVVQKYSGMGANPVQLADESIKQVANDLGIAPQALPNELADLIRTETAKALQQGKTIDAAALARKSEFEKLGMQPLQGQITRDPTQYAQELNLRGASPEIAGRLNEQNRVLQGIFANPAQGAAEAEVASSSLADVLRKYDVSKRSEVSQLYKQARESAGKDLEIPLQGLAQDYADVLDRFGDKVPSGVRNQFKKYGLEGEKQTKLFTVEEADKLMKTINDNQGDQATNAALSALRNSVRNAVEAVDASGGVFAPAVAAAKKRFSQLESVPALKNAVENGEVGNDFARKFIINDKNPKNVSRLAELLRNQSPEAFSQAKAQVADDIRRAAFGENMANDAPVSPERLAKKLRDLGSEKLSAFFTPEEVANYQTAARVAAYIAKHPNAAPVNTSNTLVAQLMTSPAAGLAAKAADALLPNVVTAGVKAAGGAVKNQMSAANAMKTDIATKKLDLTKEQLRLLAKAVGNVGSGVSSQFAQ